MKKKITIRTKLQLMVIGIAVIAVILNVIVGSLALMNLRTVVSDSSKRLSTTLSAYSNDVMMQNMKDHLTELARSKASIASERLNRYANDIYLCANYLMHLYADADMYGDCEILPPDPENDGTLSIYRVLRDTSVTEADVHDDIALLGNIENIWQTLSIDSDLASIYLGTESGVMICMDDLAGVAATGVTESYYDYTASDWYNLAKEEAIGPVFTGTYQDGYDCGLTISCAQAFYDAQGEFAGVVCLDIRLEKLNQDIIETDDETVSVLLVDRDGLIIASPDMSPTDTPSVNICTNTRHSAHSIADSILSGSIGILRAQNNKYYYAFAPVAYSDWTLVLEINADIVTSSAEAFNSLIMDRLSITDETMRSEMQSALLIILVIAAVLVVLIYVATRILSYGITRPLTQLMNGVTKISNGELEYRNNIHTGDEIEELAHCVNSMAGSLQRHIADLTNITAEKERIGAELNIANQIQVSMLPYIFPPYPDRDEFDIYATMNPAKTVGGDFYDFYLLDDDHLAVVMADVSGKGIPAALFMAISKSLIKSAVQTGLTPAKAIEEVNTQLCDNNAVGMFVTVWLGILEISTGRIKCVNAGHEYPVVYHDGRYNLYSDDPHGPMIGILDGLICREYEIQLEEGDRLFLYTDGVTEATDANEELFGEDRMIKALNRHTNDNCEDLLVHMKDEIDAFVGDAPQFDDITMLAVEIRKKG